MGSAYEIGKEIQAINNRLDRIEKKIALSSENLIPPNGSLEDSSIVELVPNQIFPIIKGEIAETSALTAPSPKLFSTGGSSRWKTGFPEFAKYCDYRGTVWLQNDVGDQLIWHFIETGSTNGEAISYPNYKFRSEARSTHVCSFGCGVLTGWHAFRSWGRFVQEDGSGWICYWGAY